MDVGQVVKIRDDLSPPPTAVKPGECGRIVHKIANDYIVDFNGNTVYCRPDEIVPFLYEQLTLFDPDDYLERS